MPMSEALWVPMVGGEKTPPGVAAAGFRRWVPVVVGEVPVVSVDDLSDRGAGCGVVNEVFSGGEGGD
jgi:hypothetical protein